MSAPIVLGSPIDELPPKAGNGRVNRWFAVAGQLPADGTWVEVVDGVSEKGTSSARKAAGRAGLELEARSRRVFVRLRQPATSTVKLAEPHASGSALVGDPLAKLVGAAKLNEFARIHRSCGKAANLTADALGYSVPQVERLVKQAREAGIL